MEFTVALGGIPFDLDYTLDSGQVFRWENRGEWWYGVLSGGVLKVRQEADSLRCSSSLDSIDSAFVRHYFRLDEDLESVLASITKGDAMTRAAQRFYGMRLIRQDRWECLASFVLATNSNIPRIKKMVAGVCEALGGPFEFEGVPYRSFPGPETVADATVAQLEACGLGYRAPFLKRVAGTVAGGRVDFSELSLLDYEPAREALLRRLLGEKVLHGVGPKVADCVLLFSCGKDEAFPIDVWIARALSRHYPSLLDEGLRRRLSSAKKSTIARGEYARTSEAARRFFGPSAGYAQQYLFMLARAEADGG